MEAMGSKQLQDRDSMGEVIDNDLGILQSNLEDQ